MPFTSSRPEVFHHKIDHGDTFHKLAKLYNTKTADICAANPQINPNTLRTGQIVCIPIGKPAAVADIKGGPLRPQIKGIVRFYRVPGGSWVCVDVEGLPPYQQGTKNKDPVGPHGFHIHEFGVCEIGNPKDPFQAAGGHWNPTNQPHGNHAGDFPVLFSNRGVAKMCFFDGEFTPDQVINKSIIIHENPDDYRTQPAGNAGKRLACGVIRGL
jgi:Cu-Zn family superoxide dismutase